MVNLIGQKFGKLIVIEKATNLYNRTAWICRCDCGNYKKITSHDLKSNKVKSCGCLRKEIAYEKGKNNKKHGLTKNRIYRIWSSMKQRCYYKNSIEYYNYGGRGIKVCNEWLDKEKGFINFYNWAIINGYQDTLTLDRIKTDADYEPNNCRWVTYKKQANNRRNNRYIYYKNKKYTISELSNKINIPYATLLWRINNNWNEEELSMKVNLNNKYIRSGKYEQSNFNGKINKRCGYKIYTNK